MNVVTKSLIPVASAVLVAATAVAGVELTDEEVENLVRRSYQYVAVYNVINKGAMDKDSPMKTGWNGTFAAPGLLDHTMKAIARPNNDTLYVTSNLDLRNEPIVVSYPAFDSKFVCLETSAYDHYADIPLSTTKGDFKEPTTILYYSSRTKGYSGDPVKGVDKIMEMTGDFTIAFLRVMPHASEPELLQKNLAINAGGQGATSFRVPGQSPHHLRRTIDFPAFSSDFGYL